MTEKHLTLINKKADARIGFKLSAEEKRLIEKEAEKYNMTVSKYIRYVMLKSLSAKG